MSFHGFLVIVYEFNTLALARLVTFFGEED